MMHNTEIKAGSVAAPLSVTGPQPVWLTLNEARERAFTGEIVFEVDPEVVAYLDNGVVYYAERTSDTSLGRRLLDSGLVDVAQLERGTVKVGDVEHLGRLFDREPSVDRDAVIVMVSTMTEELIADIANHAIAAVRVTAYRHHPSGVHRWFVAPFGTAVNASPSGSVAHVGTSAVDDVLLLPFDGMEPDELTIDWLDPIDGVDALPAFYEFEPSMFDVELSADTADTIEDGFDHVPVLDDDVVELSFELAEFIDDIDDMTDVDAKAPMTEAGIDSEIAHVIDTDVAAITELVDELLVIDESVEVDETVSMDAVVEIHEPPLTDELVEVEEWTPFDEVSEASTTHDSVTEVAPSADDVRNAAYVVVWPEPAESAGSDIALADSGAESDAPSVEEAAELAEVSGPTALASDDIEPYFVLPPLELIDEPETAGATDDVAEAVRRAILVIEAATIEATGSASGNDNAEDSVEISTMATSPAPSLTAGHRGFAPPTLETRAEALYERRAAAMAASPGDGPSAAIAGQDVGAADTDADSGERRSALRRLIGSLRRKDS